jgi:hypothetical protein
MRNMIDDAIGGTTRGTAVLKRADENDFAEG